MQRLAVLQNPIFQRRFQDGCVLSDDITMLHRAINNYRLFFWTRKSLRNRRNFTAWAGVPGVACTSEAEHQARTYPWVVASVSSSRIVYRIE